ncbi:hypothetical protein [Nocardia cyriacigeorgica]|uniref:hypothetical protein n=1 Tax=Nocardia cyriacigeorgica TaxID=135487 RepID=UPI002455C112|nr:hypothetical protein [Nocardia cyriacigeorgica]
MHPLTGSTRAGIHVADFPSGLVRDGGYIPPRKLYAEFKDGGFTDIESLAEAIDISWHGPFPTTDLGPAEWSEMYRKARSFLRIETPPGDGDLYRGCNPEFKLGMSWTSDFRVAEKYARTHAIRTGEGQVYSTPMITRHDVLGFYDDKQEFVLDPRGLIISPVDMPITGGIPPSMSKWWVSRNPW